VTKQRGEALTGTGIAETVVATVHPSSILRQETEDDRLRAMEELVADLRVVAKLL
jgi:hypothetical protein